MKEGSEAPYPYEFDPAVRRKARELSRRSFWLNMLSGGTGILMLIVLLGSGAAEGYSIALSQLPLLLSVAIFTSTLITLFYLVEILFSYLRFRIRISFGISTQSGGQWLQDQAKGFLAGLLLGVVAVEVLFQLISKLPSLWWLAAATIYVVLSFAYSSLFPLLFARFFYSIKPLQDPRHLERLTDLLGKLHLSHMKIYTINESSRSRSVNAFVTGLGAKKKIVLYDNLLRDFRPEEVDSIVAHELGHYVRRDTALSSLLGVASAYVTSVLLYLAMEFVLSRSLIYRATDPNLLLWFALAAGIFGFASSPLMNLYSRSRERRADLFSLDITRNPKAFISSEKRLCDINLMEENVSRLRKLLFATHPTTVERIAMGEMWRDTNGS